MRTHTQARKHTSMGHSFFELLQFVWLEKYLLSLLLIFKKIAVNFNDGIFTSDPVPGHHVDQMQLSEMKHRKHLKEKREKQATL